MQRSLDQLMAELKHLPVRRAGACHLLQVLVLHPLLNKECPRVRDAEIDHFCQRSARLCLHEPSLVQEHLQLVCLLGPLRIRLAPVPDLDRYGPAAHGRLVKVTMALLQVLQQGIDDHRNQLAAVGLESPQVHAGRRWPPQWQRVQRVKHVASIREALCRTQFERLR